MPPDKPPAEVVMKSKLIYVLLAEIITVISTAISIYRIYL